MEILDNVAVLQALAKSIHKHCMYINFQCADNTEEVYKAAPYLVSMANPNILYTKFAYFTFENEAEMWKAYDETVGDDGPTWINRYDGPAQVFALTCNTDGKILACNT